jgi:hypothetical protein
LTCRAHLRYPSLIGFPKTPWQGGSILETAVFYALLLFAPPSVLLGMVVPFAVRLKLADTRTGGRTAGNLYAISTVGSIFGTFLTGFVLIAWLGSTNILLLMAAALALPYTRYPRLVEHFVPEMRRLLVLEGGGFSFPKFVMANYADVTVDVVELDPGITALARDYFELRDHPRQRIIAEDARMFLNRNRDTYDAILCDAFNSHYAIPFHLTKQEAAQRMKAALSPNGVVLVNLLSKPDGECSRFFQALFGTYTAVFPRVLAFSVGAPPDRACWQNIILAAFASPEETPQTSGDPDISAMLAKRFSAPEAAGFPVLTDDYAPLDRYLMSAW